MPTKIELPILDCSEIAGELEDIEDSEKFKNFAQKLGDGMRNIGFVYLINHDTTHEMVQNLHNKSSEFFSLPKEIKLKYRKLDAVEYFQGYTPAEDERIGEIEKLATGVAPPELKEVMDFWSKEAHDETKFPKEVPGYKASVDAFRESITPLAKKFLRCFALYLNLEDKDYFINMHRALEDKTIMSHNDVRYNYYFNIQTPGEGQEVNDHDDSVETIRLGEHCDWGTFTFLFQDDVGGLEAKMSNGQWIPVKPIKDSIVFNAGLILELWSGGNLRATYHRVKAIGMRQFGAIRRSAGFFVQPDGTAHCDPLVPLKQGWVCDYPFTENQTHFEYFRNRVRESRHY